MVTTPLGVFFHGKVKTVIVRGTEGYLGIHYDHTPLVTAVLPGKLKFSTADGKAMEASVSDGILEIKPRKVTILVHEAKWTGGNTSPNR